MPKKPVNSNMVPLDGLGIIPERDAGQPPILDIRHLCVDFGGLRAVDDFTLLIGRTEIAGLIGPNGAGKTTVFNLLTNVYKPTQGRILLNGQDTRGKSMHELNRLGIARTFQNIRLFAGMTVEDNVKVGMSHGYSDGVFTDMFRLPGWWRTERRQHVRALELLDLFNLTDKADTLAEFIKALKLDHVHAVGASLGGMYLLRAMTRFPEMFDKVTVLCPGGITKQMPRKIRRMATPFIGPFVRESYTRKDVKNALQLCYYDSTVLTREVLDQYFETLDSYSSRQALMYCLRNFDEELVWEGLKTSEHRLHICNGT